MTQMFDTLHQQRQTAFRLVLTAIVNGIPSVFTITVDVVKGANSIQCAGTNPFTQTAHAIFVQQDKTLHCVVEEESYSEYTVLLKNPGVHQ